MSNKSALAVATVVTATIGFRAYTNYRKRKAEEQQMKAVRLKVADLIKDVPGYNKPSR